jgi:hypothetical protein
VSGRDLAAGATCLRREAELAPIGVEARARAAVADGGEPTVELAPLRPLQQ